jgi:hypothetical protein
LLKLKRFWAGPGDPSGYTGGGTSMCTYAAVDTDTTVIIELWMRRQPASSAEFAPMVADGDDSGGRVEPVEDSGSAAASHEFGSGACNLWLDVFEHTARADYPLRVESGSWPRRKHWPKRRSAHPAALFVTSWEMFGAPFRAALAEPRSAAASPGYLRIPFV